MSTFYVREDGPIVELIGVTKPIPEAIERVLMHRNNTWLTDPIEDDPLALVEFGGRVCYESFDNKKRRSRLDYIRDTSINKEHGSIMEHAVFNLGVLELPRNALMELTRHRTGVAYSWRSTRYVDGWIGYSMPPAYRQLPSMHKLRVEWREEAHHNFTLYEHHKEVLKLELPNATRKEIVEAARSVLWGNCTTDGEFTVNLRALRHIYKLRSAEGADAMMQEFAHAIYNATKEYTKGLLDNE